MSRFAISLLFVLLLSSASGAKIWHVGASRQYTSPSQVMSLVSNGDTVEIDAGLYVKDVGAWNADSLVLRCSSGYAHLDAQGTAAQRKAIWVINGKRTYVEGIEFSGCAISAADGENGAGIRQQGTSLECRRCYFHDNQEGILTGKDTESDIMLEACEFARNGVETGANAGYEHNIYIGQDRSLTACFCYFHESVVGHELKTRALHNYILYNHIVDGLTGDASYSIDVPQGGLAIIVGNTIEKGPMAQNPVVISYGEEWKPGVFNPDSEIYIANNTVVSDKATATFIRITPCTKVAKIINNIFAGSANILAGSADTISNVIAADKSVFHFRNASAYDYQPTAAFPGITSATDPGSVNGFSLRPVSMYVDPLDSAMRNDVPLQIGAFPAPESGGVATIAKKAVGFNYPNPFDHITKLDVTGNLSGDVQLVVSDVLGHVLSCSSQMIVDGRLAFERGNIPAGVYRYRITSRGANETVMGSMVVQ